MSLDIGAIRKLQADHNAGMPAMDEFWSWFTEFDNGEQLRPQFEFIGAIGASFGPFLSALADHLVFEATVRRSIVRGKSAAHITGHLLRWLPWLALLVSQALGLPTLSFLLFRPAGWALLAVSVVLSFFADRTVRGIVVRVSQMAPDPGIWLTLTAGALKQGSGTNQVVDALRTVTGRRVLEVEGELGIALIEGGTVSAKLQAKADQLRDQAKQAKELELEQLPFRLLLPMGMFLVPQFLLLMVLPLVLAALSSVPNLNPNQ